MAQKTHPLGFRIGVSKPHLSTWYASSLDYSLYVKEDIFIRKFLHKKLSDAMVSNVEIKRRKYVNKGICITCNIYVANPNSVIFSSKGTTIYELRNTLFLLLVKFFGKRELSFNILGVSNPDTDARILAYFIREQLEKRISHKRVMQSAILKAKKSGVKGVKVQISGRLNGAEIARTEWEREGQVPLQTLRANIDYCSMTAKTVFGILGIKVWIYVV